MKVLSVDDNAENLYLLEALLQGHGHAVDSASNGEEGLALARKTEYDAIVSDILMPRMDGFQFCRELKKDERLRRIPFFFHTATYTDTKDADFALSLGAAGFFRKPCDPQHFVREIEKSVAEGAGTGSGQADVIPVEDEAIYLKEYNGRLVAKLETKMVQLERANRALQEDLKERERATAERARLELELRQAHKMEAIGTLAGGIAHDFNNILGGIIGYAELGLRDNSEDSPNGQHFQEILKAGRRARDLIRQILAFSRHGELELQPLQIGACVQDAAKLLRASLPATIDIGMTLGSNLPTVLADPTQVHQIVTNLVTNAWHAIGEAPGEIELDLSVVNVTPGLARECADLRPGRYVRLSVSDTGLGIDSEKTSRIFEPFFTTKEAGKGSGLGLSVVHGIIKSYHGGIVVKSTPGAGTRFDLYFPALEVEEPASPEPAVVSTPGGGQRVLFIDDEPVLCKLGERFLTVLGYDPVVHTDPKAAVTAFNEQKFDVVITDLTMPHSSGIDVANLLWNVRPGTPIVLATGYTASLDQVKAREIGFCELLLKPYNLQDLAACVARALGKPVA